MNHFSFSSRRFCYFLKGLSFLRTSKAIRCFFVSVFITVIIVGNLAAYGQVVQDEWQLLSEVDGVKAYYRIGTCASQTLLHLRIQNGSVEERKVIWPTTIERGGVNEVVVYQSMAPVLLRAGDEIIGDCNNQSFFLSVPVQDDFHISRLQFSLIIQQ